MSVKLSFWLTLIFFHSWTWDYQWLVVCNSKLTRAYRNEARTIWLKPTKFMNYLLWLQTAVAIVNLQVQDCELASRSFWHVVWNSSAFTLEGFGTSIAQWSKELVFYLTRSPQIVNLSLYRNLKIKGLQYHERNVIFFCASLIQLSSFKTSHALLARYYLEKLYRVLL